VANRRCRISAPLLFGRYRDNENRSVRTRRQLPRRPGNRELRPREYLIPSESKRLSGPRARGATAIETRHGSSWPTGMGFGRSSSATWNGRRSSSADRHPCKEPPRGPHWIHEIKHDGFRILARRDVSAHPALNGYDFAARFPKIAAMVESLPVRSCMLDGEAVVVDEHGLSVFDALRYRFRDHDAVLCAFDLLELDGADFRTLPLGLT
jgi:ATP dependent DNA ligase domain